MPAPSTPVGSAAAGTRKLLLPALLTALVVLTVAVAVLAMRARQQPSVLTSTPAPPVPTAPLINAPTLPPTQAPPLTNAPVNAPLPAPAVTNAPTRPAPSLPPDVAAYLNFLGQIEQRRVAMNSDLSGATAMLGAAQAMQGAGMDPEGGEDSARQNTAKINSGYNDYALKWQTLIRDFRAAPPPPACTLLANNYLRFLTDYTTIITKMQVALLNHDSHGLPDLSGVGQVQAQVNADGAKADGALGDLCARYGVPKPFVISPEGASPSLLGH